MGFADMMSGFFERWFNKKQPSKSKELVAKMKEEMVRGAEGHDQSLQRVLKAVAEVKERQWSEPEPFYLCNGEVLRGPSDLEQTLSTMPTEVFSHHVNSERNDFAAWIAHSFNDSELARRVQQASDAATMVQALKGEEETITEEVHYSSECPTCGASEDYLQEIQLLREEITSIRKALSEEIASGFKALAKENESKNSP
jgi:hypothetical protein